MKPVYVESGACILHALTKKLESPDFEPIMSIGAAVVVGVKLAYSGSLPPLCETCEQYMRALFTVNGVTLIEMSQGASDEIKQRTGSRFVRLPDPKKDVS